MSTRQVTKPEVEIDMTQPSWITAFALAGEIIMSYGREKEFTEVRLGNKPQVVYTTGDDTLSTTDPEYEDQLFAQLPVDVAGAVAVDMADRYTLDGNRWCVHRSRCGCQSYKRGRSYYPSVAFVHRGNEKKQKVKLTPDPEVEIPYRIVSEEDFNQTLWRASELARCQNGGELKHAPSAGLDVSVMYALEFAEEEAQTHLKDRWKKVLKLARALYGHKSGVMTAAEVAQLLGPLLVPKDWDAYTCPGCGQ